MNRRLEAAAIGAKMLTALDPEGAASVSVLAARFGISEPALRRAVGHPGIQPVYDRIHSNGQPGE